MVDHVRGDGGLYTKSTKESSLQPGDHRERAQELFDLLARELPRLHTHTPRLSRPRGYTGEFYILKRTCVCMHMHGKQRAWSRSNQNKNGKPKMKTRVLGGQMSTK